MDSQTSEAESTTSIPVTQEDPTRIPSRRTLATITVDAAGCRYRLVARCGDRLEVIAARPLGRSVALEHREISEVAQAASVMLRWIVEDFDSRQAVVFRQLQRAVSAWREGRPGLGPRSAAARREVERVGNRYLRLTEAFAGALRKLKSGDGEVPGVPIEQATLPPMLREGLATLERGEGGRWVPLEELVPVHQWSKR